MVRAEQNGIRHLKADSRLPYGPLTWPAARPELTSLRLDAESFKLMVVFSGVQRPGVRNPGQWRKQ